MKMKFKINFIGNFKENWSGFIELEKFKGWYELTENILIKNTIL